VLCGKIILSLSFTKTSKMNDILRFALIVLVLLVVYYFVNNQTTVLPNAGAVTATVPAVAVPPPAQLELPPMNAQPQSSVASPDNSAIAGSPEVAVGASFDHLNWDGLGDSELQGALSKQYQDLTGSDLLPHNDIAQFAEVYPNGVGQMQNKSFLHAGHHVGINTLGQARGKNPNYQIRSEPANPMAQVSPWQQSSINADLTRRPFDIGAECEP
jgi:hypothetical protein